MRPHAPKSLQPIEPGKGDIEKHEIHRGFRKKRSDFSPLFCETGKGISLSVKNHFPVQGAKHGIRFRNQHWERIHFPTSFTGDIAPSSFSKGGAAVSRGTLPAFLHGPAEGEEARKKI